MSASMVELAERARRLRAQYADLEQARYGRSWSVEEVALGFVGDVGDLAKLVQAHNGVRQIPEVELKLAHELADCLWSVLVLADLTGVDLESAFLQTMDGLERSLATEFRLPGRESPLCHNNA
jgi:NTP pyrophosphatase (non-canonical NTP hydrolase)